MEKLEEVMDMIVDCVCQDFQTKGAFGVDTHEMGEVIDLLKDLYNIKYYCKLVKAMEDGSDTIKTMVLGT